MDEISVKNVIESETSGVGWCAIIQAGAPARFASWFCNNPGHQNIGSSATQTSMMGVQRIPSRGKDSVGQWRARFSFNSKTRAVSGFQTSHDAAVVRDAAFILTHKDLKPTELNFPFGPPKFPLTIVDFLSKMLAACSTQTRKARNKSIEFMGPQESPTDKTFSSLQDKAVDPEGTEPVEKSSSSANPATITKKRHSAHRNLVRGPAPPAKRPRKVQAGATASEWLSMRPDDVPFHLYRTSGLPQVCRDLGVAQRPRKDFGGSREDVVRRIKVHLEARWVARGAAASEEASSTIAPSSASSSSSASSTLTDAPMASAPRMPVLSEGTPAMKRTPPLSSSTTLGSAGVVQSDCDSACSSPALCPSNSSSASLSDFSARTDFGAASRRAGLSSASAGDGGDTAAALASSEVPPFSRHHSRHHHRSPPGTSLQSLLPPLQWHQAHHPTHPANTPTAACGGPAAAASGLGLDALTEAADGMHTRPPTPLNPAADAGAASGPAPKNATRGAPAPPSPASLVSLVDGRVMSDEVSSCSTPPLDQGQAHVPTVQGYILAPNDPATPAATAAAAAASAATTTGLSRSAQRQSDSPGATSSYSPASAPCALSLGGEEASSSSRALGDGGNPLNALVHTSATASSSSSSSLASSLPREREAPNPETVERASAPSLPSALAPLLAPLPTPPSQEPVPTALAAPPPPLLQAAASAASSALLSHQPLGSVLLDAADQLLHSADCLSTSLSSVSSPSSSSSSSSSSISSSQTHGPSFSQPSSSGNFPHHTVFSAAPAETPLPEARGGDGGCARPQPHPPTSQPGDAATTAAAAAAETIPATPATQTTREESEPEEGNSYTVATESQAGALTLHDGPGGVGDGSGGLSHGEDGEAEGVGSTRKEEENMAAQSLASMATEDPELGDGGGYGSCSSAAGGSGLGREADNQLESFVYPEIWLTQDAFSQSGGLSGVGMSGGASSFGLGFLLANLDLPSAE